TRAELLAARGEIGAGAVGPEHDAVLDPDELVAVRVVTQGWLQYNRRVESLRLDRLVAAHRNREGGQLLVDRAKLRPFQHVVAAGRNDLAVRDGEIRARDRLEPLLRTDVRLPRGVVLHDEQEVARVVTRRGDRVRLAVLGLGHRVRLDPRDRLGLREDVARGVVRERDVD